MHEHSDSQFSRQQPIPFKIRFNFSDRLIRLNLCKGRKHSAPRIGNDDFPGGSPLLMMCTSTVFLRFLDNHRSFWRLERDGARKFEPRSDFSDQLNTLKLMQRPKTFHRANRVSRFSHRSPLLISTTTSSL